MEASFDSLNHLPTLLDLENRFRELPNDKPNDKQPNDKALGAYQMNLGRPMCLKPLAPHPRSHLYRSIFLSEGVGKASRKCLRGAFVNALYEDAPPLFQGCLPRPSLHSSQNTPIRSSKSPSTLVPAAPCSSSMCNQPTRFCLPTSFDKRGT